MRRIHTIISFCVEVDDCEEARSRLRNMPVTTSETFSMSSGIVDVDPYGPATTVVISSTTDSDYTLQ